MGEAMRSTFIVFVLFSLYASCCGKIEIEKYLKTCDRNSPDVSECLVDAVQEGIVALAQGIPDLGVPPVDPYHQEVIRVEYKNNQIIAKMSMYDVIVEGLLGSKVHDARLRADEDRFHLEVDLTSPRVYVHGRYHGEGRFNALKVNATGHFNNTMVDLKYTWKIDGTPQRRGDDTFVKVTSFYMRPDVGGMQAYISDIFPDNPEFMDLKYTWKIDGTPQRRGDDTFVKVTSFYMRPDVGGMQAYISDIFPDNPEFTAFANDFGNQNWRLIYRELLPYAQANWNKSGVRIANKIFLKVPYDQLFPNKL